MTLFYAICLIGGLLFTIISALMGHFVHGDGHVGTGGHAEAGADGSGIHGISFFSPVVLATFTTAFGGLGLLFSDIHATSHPWMSAPLSFVGSFVIAFGVMALFNTIFHRVQGSSESQVGSLVGMPASLTASIPPNGVGEIAYVQSSTRYTAPARSEKGVAIAVGSSVRITRIVGTQFFVEPI